MTTVSENIKPGLTLRANFSWTFIGNTINAVSWFTMTIVLAKLGSPEDVGQFALGLATTAPVFMFATLRLRDVQATDAKQEYLFEDYFAMRLTTTAAALFIILGMVLFSGFQLEMSLIILATAASKSIEAISDAFYGLFMQQERLDRIAKSMIMKGPLSLIGLGVGFYLSGRVFWAVMGLVIARAIIMLSYDVRNVILSFNNPANSENSLIPKKFPRPRWDKPTLVRLFWLTLPLGAVTMLISFNLNIPRYFVEGYLGSYQLGIFAAITAFQKAAPTVVQALGRSAAPRLSKYYAAGKAGAFRTLSVKLISMGLLLGLAGVFVAWIAGDKILTIFYGPEYALTRVFVLVMVASGTDYLATILLFIITSARNFKIQLPLHVMTTSTVAVACFFLVPPYGLIGAALSLIVADIVRLGGTMGAAVYSLRKLRKIPVTA